MQVNAQLLIKATTIISRDGRRPNGDSFSDAIYELNETNQISREEFIELDAFRALVDVSELPIK